MLSAQARPYIEASVPVLREHGLTITRVFYQNLFNEYPELSHLFNMGNQANGLQQQSLASAVFAYAANIDQAQALAPVVSRIVQKHVSVGVTAEHYPIVGKHLLNAIQEVLGAAATPELLAAWAEAYGLLADALIKAEQELYQTRNTHAGEFFPLQVAQVSEETPWVKAYDLVPANGQAVWNFQAGQYISVAVTLDDGQRQIRQYSLSNAPGQAHLRISVKREPAGTTTPEGQVSNWLHQHAVVGSVLWASPPVGDFLPAQGQEPVVLLSAGIGVTPMMAALHQMARFQPERPVIFAHAALSPEHHAHVSELPGLQQVMPNLQVVNFYEQCEPKTGIYQGWMELAQLPVWPYRETAVYLCGPLPFMQAQWQQLSDLGVPTELLHREVFGPELLDHLL